MGLWIAHVAEMIHGGIISAPRPRRKAIPWRQHEASARTGSTRQHGRRTHEQRATHGAHRAEGSDPEGRSETQEGEREEAEEAVALTSAAVLFAVCEVRCMRLF